MSDTKNVKLAHHSDVLGMSWYVMSVLTFIVTLCAGAASLEFFSFDRVPYHILLFSICISPHFLFQKKSEKTRLLVIFGLAYYLIFGAYDYFSLFLASTPNKLMQVSNIQRLALSDFLIASGIALVILGFLCSTFLFTTKQSGVLCIDWAYKTQTLVAIISWTIGYSSTVFIQLIYGKTQMSTSIFSHLIANLWFLDMIGGVWLIYIFIRKYKPRLIGLLLFFIVVMEFILGFIGDSKELSFRMPIFLLLGLFFLNGRINKKILLFLALCMVPYFAIFGEYRLYMLQMKDLSRVDAAAELHTSFNKLRKNLDKKEDLFLTTALGILNRIDGRKYVDIIAAQVDKNVPYQEGETLMLLFYSFIPKTLWSDKPQTSIGQLMNREFKLSASPLTFVPPTQLGELYWNYGVSGAMIGMFFIGILLGSINSLYALYPIPSSGKFIIVLAAAYELCLRFESGIASQYGSFFRICFIVFILHFTLKILKQNKAMSPPVYSEKIQ